MKIVKKQIYLFFLLAVNTCPLFYAIEHVITQEEQNIVSALREELARTGTVNNSHDQFSQAIESNFVQIARPLLQYGVDIQAQNNNGNTLLELATMHNNQHIIQLLENASNSRLNFLEI